LDSVRAAAVGLAAFTVVARTLFLLRPDGETEIHLFFKDIAIFGAFPVIAIPPPTESSAGT